MDGGIAMRFPGRRISLIIVSVLLVVFWGNSAFGVSDSYFLNARDGLLVIKGVLPAPSGHGGIGGLEKMLGNADIDFGKIVILKILPSAAPGEEGSPYDTLGTPGFLTTEDVVFIADNFHGLREFDAGGTKAAKGSFIPSGVGRKMRELEIVILPDDIEALADSAFEDAGHLELLVLSDGLKEIGENALNTGTNRGEFSNGLTIEFMDTEPPEAIDPKAFGSMVDAAADDKGELHVTIPPEIYFPADNEGYSSVLMPALLTAGLDAWEADNLLMRGQLLDRDGSTGVDLEGVLALLMVFVLAVGVVYVILKTTV